MFMNVFLSLIAILSWFISDMSWCLNDWNIFWLMITRFDEAYMHHVKKNWLIPSCDIPAQIIDCAIFRIVDNCKKVLTVNNYKGGYVSYAVTDNQRVILYLMCHLKIDHPLSNWELHLLMALMEMCVYSLYSHVVVASSCACMKIFVQSFNKHRYVNFWVSCIFVRIPPIVVCSSRFRNNGVRY